MSEHIELLKEIKKILSDLVYINGITATELIKITENTAVIRHGEEFLSKSSCIQEHNQLNKDVIEIVKKYVKKPEQIADLEKHILKH